MKGRETVLHFSHDLCLLPPLLVEQHAVSLQRRHEISQACRLMFMLLKCAQPSLLTKLLSAYQFVV